MIRRRLVMAGIAAAAAGAVAVPVASGLVVGPPAKERPKFAQLLGRSEAPDPGDADGRGSATIIIPSPTKVCFAILVHGIKKPNAAHIHRGAPGVAGPVVVGLTPPRTGNAGFSSGCTTGARSVLADIKAKPGSFYINVHTADFPGGALRGQLFLR
jgi:CHRD domain